MNQNLHLPPIINGLWQIADLERRGDLLPIDTLEQAISSYVDQGFETFDMADHYGSAEVIMGGYQNSHPERNLNLLTK